VNAIGVQMGGAAAAPRRDAVGEHGDHGIEVVSGEVAKGIGAPDQLPQRLDLDLALARGHRDDLLGEDVERVLGDGQAVELAGLDRAHGGGALHQLVAGEREQDAFRQRAE
jgi:hypothetical protein